MVLRQFYRSFAKSGFFQINLDHERSRNITFSNPWQCVLCRTFHDDPEPPVQQLRAVLDQGQLDIAAQTIAARIGFLKDILTRGPLQ